MAAFEAAGVPLSPSGFAQNAGANQATPKIQLTSPQSSGANWDIIQSVFQKIKSALDTEPPPASCSNWLQGNGFTGSGWIQFLLDGQRFGHATLNVKTIVAFIGDHNADKTLIQGIPANWSVTVNSTGTFFTPDKTLALMGAYTLNDGSFKGYAHASLRGRATTLIHETAHFLEPLDAARNRRFQADLGKSLEGERNDQIVHERCATPIESLQ